MKELVLLIRMVPTIITQVLVLFTFIDLKEYLLGVKIGIMCSSVNCFILGACNVVLELFEGDLVNVKMVDSQGDDGMIDGGDNSGFQGFSLHYYSM